MADDADPFVFPNADAPRARPPGPSRRRLVTGTAAIGAAAVAGCVGSDEAATSDRGTVFVFNTADGTVSIVDVATDEVVRTASIGVTSSFPSNQFSPRLTDRREQPLWLNVDRGVRALAVGSLSTIGRVDTGSGANWLERTPDGRHVIVSAREPVHRQFRVDSVPSSGSFGEVTGEIDRSTEDGYGSNDGPGPCDVTIHPDGRYAYVPDLFGNTLTVLDIASFEVVEQVSVPPVGEGPARPWMATVAWDGQSLLVEHDEGQTGTESVWDVSDPATPREVTRVTAEAGLGKRPLTSEIGPNSETGYVFTPGSEDVTVIDLAAGAVSHRISLGGAAFVGTWDPAHEKLYVPVQTNNEVVVIDHATGEIATRISVGSAPYGATAATVRPAENAGDALIQRLDSVSPPGGAGTTYCIGNCACGHEL